MLSKRGTVLILDFKKKKIKQAASIAASFIVTRRNVVYVWNVVYIPVQYTALYGKKGWPRLTLHACPSSMAALCASTGLSMTRPIVPEKSMATREFSDTLRWGEGRATNALQSKWGVRAKVMCQDFKVMALGFKSLWMSDFGGLSSFCNEANIPRVLRSVKAGFFFAGESCNSGTI